MERRNVDILCLQETKWKGSKARNIGGGCKLFYNGSDGRRNRVGDGGEGEAGRMYLEGKEGIRQTNGHETKLIAPWKRKMIFGKTWMD